jgi:hypothetical protein
MRLAWELFGQNLAWLRLFPALAQSIAMLLAGLIARDHPLIFLCRGLKLPWPQFWEAVKTYS